MHSLLHDIPRFLIIFLKELFLKFNQMLNKERLVGVKKEKEICRKKLNIIEIRKSVIKYCIFFQFMYTNIKVSVNLNLKVSGG